ncbi:MAG: PAS domain S-box protein [Planctomycetales bacterium]|nr:PAS domain S-box protein [Planctomycetales bacterium]
MKHDSPAAPRRPNEGMRVLMMRIGCAFFVVAAAAAVSCLILNNETRRIGSALRQEHLSERLRSLTGMAAHESEQLLLVKTSSDAASLTSLEHLRQLVARLTNQLAPPKASEQGSDDVLYAIWHEAPHRLRERLDKFTATIPSVALEGATPIPEAIWAFRFTPESFEPVDHSSVLQNRSPNPGAAALDALIARQRQISAAQLAALEDVSTNVAIAMLALGTLATAYASFALVRQSRVERRRATAAQQHSQERAAELEAAVAELEAIREEDSRRALAVLNIMSDLRRERSQLQREAEVRQRAEQQFRSVVESAPSPMIMIDRSRTIVLANRAAETMFGYAREEIIGQPIEMLVPHRFRADHPQRCEKFLRNPHTTSLGQGRELYGLRKDGTEFVAEIGLNPITTHDGVFILSSIVDLTAHKQALESTARLAAVVASSHDAIVSVSLDGKIASWNRGAALMYGYELPAALGKHCAMLAPVERRDEIEELLRRVAVGETVENWETRLRRRDGSTIDVAITASPIRDAAGLVVGSSMISRDVTQQKIEAEKLAHYARDLERSNRELEQFAYVASHDLKEPLRMVASYAQLLGEDYSGQLDSQADRYIAYAIDGAQRMSALIDDLLNYSRVGRTDAPFEPTSLDQVVREALRDLRVRMTDLDARIVVPRQLPQVLGNSTRLSQLFLNLLGNALKFRHPDRKPEVHISASVTDVDCEIAITDNGIGIASDYHERIFDVFQRLHTVDEYPGTGIGLAVCKKIVEHHGGVIRVTSTPDEGTTFFFTLPLAADKEDRESPGSLPSPSTAPEGLQPCLA